LYGEANEDPLCGQQRVDDDCDSNSPNFVPGNPACICNEDLPTFEPENPICDPCNENNLDFMPDNPDCVADDCDENSPNFVPDNAACVCNEELPTFEPENPICDPCNENNPDFVPDNPDCATDDCNENSPDFVPDNAACICNEDLPTFEPENPICDPCNEKNPNFVPDNPDCITDDCNEASPNFVPDNPACICNEDLPTFEPDNPICDPCNENSPDFLPNNPNCGPSLDDSQSTQSDPNCKSLLTGINTSKCLVTEEYQAMTCGDCPDVDIDIAALIEVCRTPSSDLFECMANIGSMESNGQSCKMYEFKFIKSTMSGHCKRPKAKYPVSSPKPAYRYERTNYIKRGYKKGRRNIFKVTQGPRRIQNYRTTKLHKPKRMVRLMHRRY